MCMRGHVGEGPLLCGPTQHHLPIIICTVESLTPRYKRLVELFPDAWMQYPEMKSEVEFERLSSIIQKYRKAGNINTWLDKLSHAIDRIKFEEEHNLKADDWCDHWDTLFAVTYGYRWEDK